MNPWFTVTYALVFVLILMETLVLRSVLRKTIWFRRFYGDTASREENAVHFTENSAPEFSLPLLESGKTLTACGLKGAPSILCFVSEKPAAWCQSLMPALHAWWHRMEGRVYLVCSGTEGACRDFASQYAHGFPLDKIIHDKAGLLARSFQVAVTPQAVELDANLKVKRYGRPESLELEPSNGEPLGGSEPSRHGMWPEDRPFSGAGFARVDTPISCVLSRFHLHSPLSLIPFYLAFRRVRRAAHDIAGLMEAVFLVEGPRTCYTLSLWKDDWSIVDFGRIRAHIDAANSAFDATYRTDAKRAEIWSAQFRLWAVSCHNLSWESVDLEAALGEQWRRREEVAHSKEQRVA
jgi:AhpC/TSA family